MKTASFISINGVLYRKGPNGLAEMFYCRDKIWVVCMVCLNWELSTNPFFKKI